MWSENIERNLQNMAVYDEGKAVGKEEGIEQGIEQGIEKGKQENLREIVLRMHANNLELEVIAKCTLLSNEEIMEIINELSQ